MPGVKNPRNCKLLTTLIIIVVVVVVLMAIGIIQNVALKQRLKYGIVIDAGSSHTSLYIYQWPAEKMNDTGLVKELTSCKVKGPGISSYWMDVKKAGLSLTDCLNDAKKRLPAKQHRDTPVYLGATAGMRLLRLQNRQLSNSLLNSVQEFIKTYPFNLQGARILTGQDEGAFGWITINYLMGNFLEDSGRKYSATLGALDLGGASTQITFVPDGYIESEESSLYFRLYGKNYNIYTHSYLCYGKDQAHKMLLDKLNVHNEETISDPCFNSGYTKVINATDFFDTPCVSRKESAQQALKIIGTGDSTQCTNVINKIFDFTSCNWTSCSFNGVYQPPLQGQFGAFSAYYYVMKFLNLTKYGPHDLDKVKKAVEKFCSMPWVEVKSVFSTDEKYLSEYCFAGHYILSLLQNGYNFTSTNWKAIKFVGKIEGNEAGWTLGYMLNLTNMIPAELPYTKPLTHSSYLTIMIVFSILLFILLLIGFLIFKRKLCGLENKM